jgi:hypothetical protein
MYILHMPYLFGNKRIGEPHGEEIVLIIPLSNNSWNYFLIYALSITDYLYIPILEGGASYYKYISCLTSLLGGNPIGS